MKRLLLAASLLLGATGAFAQNSVPHIPRCGFELIWKKLEKGHPGFRRQYDAQFTNTTAGTASKTTGVIYHIPVVFHVVYFSDGSTVKGNVPDSVLVNQIAVLNGAYRKNHPDTGSLRAIFKPIAADAEIEFYLAATDPNGNPTTGITRTSTNVDGFGDIATLLTGDISSIERIRHTADGGEDAWTTSKYLNIWVADMSINFAGQSIPAILGIATPPLNPLPANWGTDTTGFGSMKDGVTIQYQCAGNNNPWIGDLSQFGAGTAGRTAVHEVGHYLGLRHIWGDATGTPDACTTAGDDGISDTPMQDSSSAMGGTCPTATQNSCGAGTTGDMPDLWENYMDYSRDNCQDMFSQGQVSHMRSICANQRDTLVNQPVPNGIGSTVKSALHSLIVYPQPAGNELVIAFEGTIDELRLTNTMGQQVLVISGGSANATRRINVATLPSGSYFLQLRDGAHLYSKRVMVQR